MKGTIEDVGRELSEAPLWIGLVGAAGAGKTTVSEMLSRSFTTRTPYLAKPIKDVAQKYYGMSTTDCYSQEGKSEDHPFITFEGGEIMTNRNVLEEIGDKLQEIDPLILLRAAEERLGEESETYQGVDPDLVLFPDLRTEPQAEFIRDRGGLVVYVQRDHPEARAEAIEDAHHTKTFYNRTEHDFLIDNNGSLSDLSSEIEALALDISPVA